MQSYLKRRAVLAEESKQGAGGGSYMKDSLLSGGSASEFPSPNESLSGPIVGIYTSRYTESGTELA